jgi:hypothetical protein
MESTAAQPARTTIAAPGLCVLELKQQLGRRLRHRTKAEHRYLQTRDRAARLRRPTPGGAIDQAFADASVMHQHLHQDEFGHRARRCRLLAGKDRDVRRPRGIAAEMIRAGADGNDLPQIGELPEKAGRRRPYHRHRDFTDCAGIDFVASKHAPMWEGGAKRPQPGLLILALDMDGDRMAFGFGWHEASVFGVRAT